MKVVSKTCVEGEDELSIQLDRGRIKYSRQGRRLNIQIEHGIGEISIYKGSITKWFPPYAGEEITNKDKAEIIAIVCEAMGLMGVRYTIE